MCVCAPVDGRRAHRAVCDELRAGLAVYRAPPDACGRGSLYEELELTEGLYPVTGVNSLTIDTSVAQGVATLNNAIMQQIADGNHVDVFGYSQSSAISSMEMSQLAAEHVRRASLFAFDLVRRLELIAGS
jgi:hypothetical protein